MKKIKIINFNLKSGIPVTKGYHQYITMWWKDYFINSPEATHQAGAYLAEEKPTIVFLTEIDGGSNRTNSLPQPALLNTYFQGYFVFFPATKFRNVWTRGNAILSLYPIVSHTSYRLPGKGEPRYVGEMIVKIDGVEVALYVTHLSLNKANRLIQIKEIVRIIDLNRRPKILAGDFNTVNTEEVAPLLGHFEYMCTENTFPSWRPFRNLDYIFLSSDFDLHSEKVDPSIRISDHLPLHAIASFDL